MHRQNLRYALRMLRKNLGLTATVVFTLALGIGATTAIYTVVYATLIAPMPYPNPDQLVMVWSTIHGQRNGASAAGDFLDWVEQSKSFQALKAFSGTSFNLGGKQEPEMVPAQMTTPGMYAMMGNRFVLGRDFLPEEATLGKEHEAILMNKMWRRLGADPNIVGKQIMLDQKPYTVVGGPLGFHTGAEEPRLSLAAGDGPPERRRDDETGAVRYGCGHRAHRRGKSPLR
jgi:putative ABC transport system permease protein